MTRAGVGPTEEWYSMPTVSRMRRVCGGFECHSEPLVAVLANGTRDWMILYPARSRSTVAERSAAVSPTIRIMASFPTAPASTIAIGGSVACSNTW